MKHTKRLLCVLLSIVLVAACFVTGAVAKVAYGDVTHDGEINAADALAVLKFAVDKQEFTPEEEKNK